MKIGSNKINNKLDRNQLIFKINDTEKRVENSEKSMILSYNYIRNINERY